MPHIERLAQTGPLRRHSSDDVAGTLGSFACPNPTIPTDMDATLFVALEFSLSS